MRQVWLAFAAALTIGAAALAPSTPAAAQCGGCYGSYEPRGLFTSAGYGCGGCGGCGAGYSGAGYYGGGYSGGYYGRGIGVYSGGYYGRGYYGRGYYGGGYYGGGYYRPRVTALGIERRHARRVYRRAYY